ncbi:16S rRNA (adenine(1518)-N(6)/adenine(1519)-N(6))-dimethyltransferase RsmA [Rubrivirga sp.]|uniref:16S rRNA (adenine(1518)-N(6)/adenine(1519)-N(6))- dimethyltransferase RsmA n=1 Tax=Rubrivirga sp. TaxID=1885344 RepID=UPI003C72EEE7
MAVRPKKRLGQHFLTDDAVIRQIVASVEALAGGGVVEIGPGEGALTGLLLQRYPEMVALEVDPESIAHLQARHPDLDVRERDVLEVDWPALAAELCALEDDARLQVVGNLPYYITSPILFALLDARAHIGRAVVMVQLEVADRLVAPPGSKTYGTLSVYFSLFARTEKLFDVSRECFRPMPSVESAVVALDFAGVELPDISWKSLQRVVRAAFGQRRKMLRNSLGPLAREAGVDLPEWAATLRPEAVSPHDFVRLAHHLA